MTTFYVFKVDNTYVKIEKNYTNKGKMFLYKFVKNINEASYWKDKNDLKSWMLEREFPNGKIIICELTEKK